MFSNLLKWLNGPIVGTDRRRPRAGGALGQLDAMLLEDRVLYSVTPLPDAGVDAAMLQDLDAAVLPPVADMTCGGLLLPEVDRAAIEQEQSGEGSTLPSVLPPLDLSHESLESDSPLADGAERHELILVDKSIHNVEQLVNSLLAENSSLRDADIVYLDSARDGFAQVDEALTGDVRYDAVHFVTHGDAGMIRLGGSWLDAVTVEQRMDQIQGWADSLTADADLLFYGCETATGDSGGEWLRLVGELAGADVAASDDNTGHASRGGDWELEYQLGSLETVGLLSAATQDSWQGLLATFAVTNTSDSGVGSLRQAMLDANASVGADTISFNIDVSDPNYDALSGTWQIQLLSDLPMITEAVLLDGWSQSGFSGSPVIELDGSLAAGSTAAFLVKANDTTIRGFIIHSFSDDGIELSGDTGFADNNFVHGNWIGIDATGAAAPNGDHGVLITTGSGGNVIGGTGANEGNIISGNGNVGIVIRNAGSDGNVIVGNWIGVGADGVTAVGNVSHGIEIIDTSANNRIGGAGAGEGNIIANSGGDGVSIAATSGSANTILGNSIHANGDHGIDLNNDGVTANDVDDVDVGANELQNFAAITSATSGGGETNLVGTLDSAAATTYRIEFFASSAGDASGHGEGAVYLGFTSVTTDASGDATFNTTLAGVSVTAGYAVTATATVDLGGGAYGSTSEFGPNAAAVLGNSSPTLDATRSPAMNSVLEDAGAPSGAVGTLVSSLVDFAAPAGQVDNVTDPDAGAQLGIAVTASDANGTWYYSVDDGANWNLVGAVSDASARLLAADAGTRIYFRPNADFNGNVATALTIRAWDQTSGANGTLADVSTNGGLTAYSATTDAVSISVTAVNDNPDLGVGTGPYIYPEGSGAVVLDAFATVTDIDSANFAGGEFRIQFTANGQAEDILAIRNQGVGAGQIGVSGNNVTYGGVTIGTHAGGTNGTTPLVITFNANATPAAVQALVRNITYLNLSDNPSAAVRTVEATINDGDGGTSTPVGGDLVVVPSNDAPRAADERLSIDFDGVDDYVNLGSDASLRMTNTMTMEAWINPDVSANVNQMIINKEGEYEIAIFPDGHLQWGFANTTPGWNWHDTGYVVTPGEWTHVAVTYDNGVVTTYVNGVSVEVFGGTGSIGDSHVGLNELRIGGRTNSPAGKHFDGRIDDVRIWNSVRTGAEIAGAMNSELTGGEAGLAGYWTFNENSGATAADLSANGNTGTLTNSPTWYGYRIAEDSTLNATVPGVLANDFDAEGDMLTAELVAGPANGMLTFNTDGSFSYTPTLDFTGTDSFTYRTFDGTAYSNVATVSIVVDPGNDAPVITSNGGGATGAANVAENTTTVATVTATDGDGPAASYSIAGGVDAALFIIDSTTGELTFLAAPNREAPADVGGNNVYDVIVQVSDGIGGSDSQALSITVTDADEFDVGPVTDASAIANVVNENAANGTLVGITATATDADATNNAIAYSLDDSAGGRFAVDAISGIVSVADGSLLDHGAAASHAIVVRATSADGSFSTQTFTVNVTDVLIGGPPPEDNSDPEEDSGGGGNDSSTDDSSDDPQAEDGGGGPGVQDNPSRPPTSPGTRERRHDDASAETLRVSESIQRSSSNAAAQQEEAAVSLFGSVKTLRRMATAAERAASYGMGDILDADTQFMNLALLQLRNEIQSSAQFGGYVAGSVAIASAATSAGYALWALRSAHFVTTFLATIPAWQRFDPLPLVSGTLPRKRDEGESLAEIASGQLPADPNGVGQESAS